MGIIFPTSPDPTIGVEIELQTLDPSSLALMSGAPRVIEHFNDDPNVKKELLQCCLELCTNVCRDVREVEVDLQQRLRKVLELGQTYNLRFISAGTHPFSCWHDQEVTADVRYHNQLERTQWTARRLLTFGLHVHVGVDSAEKAIAVFNAMASYLPHLLALSASSPFWEGVDTGLESARSKIFESLPGGGLPYRMRNWVEFQRMLRVLKRVGTIGSFQEMWGDLRPHLKYGTLEVRVCDAMPCLEELLAVVALVQALVVWLGDLYERGSFIPTPRYWILQENKWRAVRWGMNARLVTDDHGGQQHFRHSMDDLLETLAPVAESLGSWHYLQVISKMLENGGSAGRQRKIFKETGSLEAVVMGLENELLHSAGLDSSKLSTPAGDQPDDAHRFRQPNPNESVWRDL